MRLGKLIVAFILAVAIHCEAGEHTVQEITRTLQSIEVGIGGTTVPPGARPLLTALKHQLRDTITDILNTEPAYLDHLRSSKQLEGYLSKQLRHHGVPLMRDDEEFDDAHPYGLVWTSIERPKGHNNLFAVTTTLGIAYGSDTSLYLYKQEGLRWVLILAMETNDYSEVCSAQESLDFEVSPPDEEGNFFVATVHTTAWDISFWQGLYYRVVRPSSDAYSPKVLLDVKDVVYLGNEDPWKLSVDENSFTLRFETGSLDPVVSSRQRLLKFEVIGDRIKRIAPLALDPRNFLEEWITEPWKEVSTWRYSSALPNAEFWHAMLHDSTHDYYVEFDFVQPIGQGLNRWIIGMDIEKMEETKKVKQKYQLPDELYFTIAKQGTDYYIKSVSELRPAEAPAESPDSDCCGKQQQ